MTTTPAGWYPDPENATQLRWWDGAQWTENRSAPPIVNPYSTSPVALKAPDGTKWNTVWIWLVVVLPFLPALGLLTIDWSRMFDFSAGNEAQMTLRMMTNPGYLLSSFGGFITFGLGLWFAYLDWRELSRRGVPRPFHWVWNLISPVYAIGRSVIVRRRTGQGISPLWVTIVLLVLSLVLTIYVSSVIISSVFSQVSQYPGVLTP